MRVKKRFLPGGLYVAIAVAWTLIALGSPTGFRDLLRFLGPALLVSLAVVWVAFTFVGSVFTWSRAPTPGVWLSLARLHVGVSPTCFAAIAGKVAYFT